MCGFKLFWYKDRSVYIFYNFGLKLGIVFKKTTQVYKRNWSVFNMNQSETQVWKIYFLVIFVTS